MVWQRAMRLDMNFGMRTPASFSASLATVAPLQDAAAPAYSYGLPSAADALRVTDRLDLSGRDLFPSAFGADTPFLTAGETAETDSSFDLYVPIEEAGELEWLSQFVEDSFSDAPYQYTGLTTPATVNLLGVDQCVARRAARSKRSRSSNPTTVRSSFDFPPSKPDSIGIKCISSRGGCSRGNKSGWGVRAEGGVRRCMHCASARTPQWRMGPKTLCNACGVRYKSGRLLPEYRPAANPAFVLTRHSNSHRKVMEILRHHKNQPPASAAAGATRSELLDGNGVC
ncbi:hypothetical protein OPV22_005749 [Ensete ventricosum]|uniref:GATA-type domain-containing protein n=1 Tax=Ensete ventricosum TaxID=4639 RepID=A0AAV8RNA8_ENSVE|nr:hypothetical protein OPV22_005749 [Ensete ventricosum]